VGGANSVEECWELVRMSEKKGVPVMLLENCCYGKEEMTLLRMIREGVFGELVHVQGGYEHDLRDEIGLGDVNRHYRQRHFLNRNAELYPTHELGPIARYLNLNRGNRMVSLVSVASKAAGLHAWLQEHRADTPLADAPVHQGDIVNTIITCAGGETILLTHDCTLPRPYSRGGRIQGTKGIWMEDNRSSYIDGRSPADPTYWTHRWESDEKYMAEFEHPLWKEYESFGMRGGHGGMDYLVLRAYVESVQNGTEPPIDVYDTAAWMSITALSEHSIASGSQSVPIPDFTNGRWLRERNAAEGMYTLD
jgi:predicted dehydrogenase